MALPHSITITAPRFAGFSWRVVEVGIAPALDALTLIGAAWFMGDYHWTDLAFIVAVGVLVNAKGNPANRRNPRLGDDLGWLLGGVAVPLLLLTPFAGHTDELDRLASLAVVTTMVLLSGRALSYGLLRAIRARGLAIESALIVGAGEVGIRIASILTEHGEYGLAPIGFLDDHNDLALPLPLLGEPRDLPAVLEEYRVRHVIVAFAGASDADLGRVVGVCQQSCAETYVVPRFFEHSAGPRGPFEDDLWGFTLVRLRHSAFKSADKMMKRGLDLVVAATLLTLLAPLFAIAAFAVKLSSPGPILFRQKRVSEGGRLFELLKFRTMRMSDERPTEWSGSLDRVTSAGRILRSSSIDELPQLINVLRGEMSLIGPRPEQPNWVDEFNVTVDGYKDRHRMQAGITGWAQVHGLRGDTSIADRARFDNRYIASWGLWLDLVILVRTFGAVLREVTQRGRMAMRAEPADGDRDT